MDIKDLAARAIEIREKYSELELKRSGTPWTNLNIMEGFVADIGELMEVIMAKEGVRKLENIDERLAHELADCLWCVLVLSKRYNIDIEKAFLQTMDHIEEKIKNS